MVTGGYSTEQIDGLEWTLYTGVEGSKTRYVKAYWREPELTGLFITLEFNGTYSVSYAPLGDSQPVYSNIKDFKTAALLYLLTL